MDNWLHSELAEMGRAHWWYRGRRIVLRSVLDTYLPAVADRRILEVGAGTGSVTMLLTDFGAVTGVEPHEGAADACRQSAPEATVLAGGVEDLARLPGVATGSFDVVGAFDVIEHLEHDVDAMLAMGDLLADDGRLVVTVPALDLLWGDHDVVNGHYRRYSQRLLVDRLDEAGFEPNYVSYFNTILFPGVAAVRILRRVIPTSKREAPQSDFRLPPKVVNTLLTRMFGLEASAMRRRALPIGSSLVAVASKR